MMKDCHNHFASRAPRFAPGREAGFTLMEVLTAMGLMSLIVFVLMSVFSNTQSAFRAGITQTDVLSGGRNAMDLLAQDVRSLTASGGYGPGWGNLQGINLYCVDNLAYTNNYMALPAGSSYRTNVLQSVFLLGRQNTTWVASGYLVVPNSTNNALFPLYRFNATAPLEQGPYGLYTNFYAATLNYTLVTNTMYWSHLLDGVVHLVVRAYDTNGIAYPNGYTALNFPVYTNAYAFYYPGLPESGFVLYSNDLPTSVDLQIGVLEDNALRRLQGFANLSPNLYNSYLLTNAANQMQLFRQQVMVPNCNLSSFQ